MIDRLESVHKSNWIHGDIKPDNVAVGSTNLIELFLIDLGLAQPINYEEKLEEPILIDRIVGSLSYTSIGAHKGVVSFRNDIESVGYMLLFFSTGELPWKADNLIGLIGSDASKIPQIICELKQAFLNALPQTLPASILKFFDAVKTMSYIDRPDYQLFRQTLE